MKKIIYIAALSFVSSWAYAADEANTQAATPAAPATEKAAAAEAKSDVRKPTGDVEKFWNEQSWKDLSAGEQKLWTVLGWNEQNWEDENAPSPASDEKTWDKLTKEEQAAATALGYDAKSWDSAGE